MPNYSIYKALLGPVDKDKAGWDENFSNSVDVTSDIQKILDNKLAIQLNAGKPLFGDDTRPVLETKAPPVGPQQYNKLFIKLLEKESNSFTNFYLIRGAGWVIRDDSGSVKDQSKKADEFLIISKNSSYKNASTGDEAAEIVSTIATIFGADPAKAAAAGALAKKAAGALGKVEDAGKDILGKLKGYTEATIEFDDGKEVGENTKAFQRCLIRFAGGNLVAERNHLREPNYLLDTKARGFVAFHSKTGPVVGKMRSNPKKNYADDGRFGPETLDAVTRLLPAMSPILQGSGITINDPKVIPTSILSSKVCEGLTGASPIGSEQQDYEKMKPPVSESKIYKEFSFLSAKNSKLHSVLMEQLKKDLKRG